MDLIFVLYFSPACIVRSSYFGFVYYATQNSLQIRHAKTDKQDAEIDEGFANFDDDQDDFPMDDQCSSTDEIAPPRESGGCVVDEDGDEENEVRDGPRKRGGSEGAGTGGAEEERYKEVQRELHEAEKKETVPRSMVHLAARARSQVPYHPHPGPVLLTALGTPYVLAASAGAQTETVTADGKIGLGSGVRVIAVRERRPAAGGTMTTVGVPIKCISKFIRNPLVFQFKCYTFLQTSYKIKAYWINFSMVISITIQKFLYLNLNSQILPLYIVLIAMGLSTQ